LVCVHVGCVFPPEVHFLFIEKKSAMGRTEQFDDVRFGRIGWTERIVTTDRPATYQESTNAESCVSPQTYGS
jgi:hypothetical protein